MKGKLIFNKKWILTLTVIALSIVVLTACNLPSLNKPVEDPIELAKQTLVFQQTQEYFQTLVAQLTEVAAEVSPEPGKPTDSPAIEPSPTQAEPQPTAVPPTVVPPTAVPPTAIVPTAVPPTTIPTSVPPTATPVPCYQVSFVADVTIPDGMKIPGGSTFTKTWRIKNSGSCAWDERFDVAFVKGAQLTSFTIYDFRKVVKPGETVDISIDMTAPTSNGVYKSEWQMVNANGEKFGSGPKGTGTFWAKIEVVDGKGAVYNFATNACSAEWSSDLNGKLPCPGDRKKAGQGYVIYEEHPIREDGGKENEPGLITRPSPTVSGGYIQGIYPAIDIKTGDQFKALIQCEGGATKCNLKFELYYKIGDGKFIEIGEWIEVHDNSWNSVSVDLSALAGNKVTFSLVVWNNGTAEDNIGLWLDPVIYRP